MIRKQPLLDIFTTTKPFSGRAAIHQENAFRSWRGNSEVGRIFVFGEVSGDSGVVEEVGAEIIVDTEKTDNGLPSVSAMFERASRDSELEIVMFTNADMIYTPDFFREVRACAEEVKAPFLMVGSRFDFDNDDKFEFGDLTSFERFKGFAESGGMMHPPSGSDYFIFSRKQYEHHPLPPLWIGRGGWDLYMIYHARKFGISSVDLSPSGFGYHQNHDYGPREAVKAAGYREDPEASYNLSLLPAGVSWAEWTLKGCSHEWRGGRLVERSSRAPIAKRKGPGCRRGHRLRTLASSIARLIRTPFGLRGRSRVSEELDSKEPGGTALRRASDGLLKLIVGAGSTRYDGWISTNVSQLNLLSEDDWNRFLKGGKVDRVLAEHVWEHLSPLDGLVALRNVYQNLAPGGRIRIAVPDGNHPDISYIDHVKPGGKGPGADDHKILYTCETLCDALRSAGFEPVPIEYWDREGCFHSKEWSASDGHVSRSLLHDRRNENGKPNYTSLFVDGVKG